MTTWTSKLAPMAVAALLACAGTASQAAIFTYTGDTTTGPTFTRPLEDLSAVSQVGVGVHYNTFSFSASVAGEYTFLTTGAFDTFALLYQAPFVPTTPLTRALAGNDDLLGLTTSGFAYTLAANTTYSYVVTGFAPADFGAFSTTIGGPGAITAAVPEPETVLMMLAGLGAIAGTRLRSQARRREEQIAA